MTRLSEEEDAIEDVIGGLDQLMSEHKALATYAANFEALSADSKAALDRIVKCTQASDQNGFYAALDAFSASVRSSYFDTRSRR